MFLSINIFCVNNTWHIYALYSHFAKRKKKKTLITAFHPHFIIYWITGPVSDSWENKTKHISFSFLCSLAFKNTILWLEHDAFRDSHNECKHCHPHGHGKFFNFFFLFPFLSHQMSVYVAGDEGAWGRIKWHWDMLSCTKTNKWQVRWRYLTSEQCHLRNIPFQMFKSDVYMYSSVQFSRIMQLNYHCIISFSKEALNLNKTTLYYKQPVLSVNS